MKCSLALAALFVLLSIPRAHAGEASSSYIELTDAPTIAVDWSKGNTQAVMLGGKRILTFSNGQKGERYMLNLKQDTTGSRGVTWPPPVHWPGGTAPTLTSTGGKTDYITFFYNGVNYDALGLSQNH